MKKLKKLIEWNTLDFILVGFVVAILLGSIISHKDATLYLGFLFIFYVSYNLYNKFDLQMGIDAMYNYEDLKNDLTFFEKIIKITMYVCVSVILFFAFYSLIF